MKDQIVILKSFSNPTEARIVKSRLESYGIPCMLTNENIVGILPIYNTNLGSVNLKVFKRDLERATALLAD